MTATCAPAPDRPDPTRTGAVWVTGTGVFLLLTAAAVFTAVRWGEIHPGVKLAALVLATGGCLIAGRTLRPTVPATAAGLFHLGTFLVPIVVAALGVRAAWTWPDMLLAQGAVAAVVFGWASVVERSVVLRWAWGASIVALAAGVAAVTPLPALPVLAAAAVVAAIAGLDRPALGWAAVAGLAPVALFVERDLSTGAGTLERLGLAAGQHPVTSSLSAVASAAVIAAVARRRARQDLVVVAAVVAVCGAGASWLGAGAGGGGLGLGVAAAVLAVQLGALVVRQDPFWHRPVALVADGAEWAAGVATGLFAMGALAAGGPDPEAMLAGLLLAAGWTVADKRRTVGLPGVSALVGLCAIVAVSFATNDPALLGATFIAVAAGALLAQRPDGLGVALVGAGMAPVVARPSAWALGVTAVAATAILAEAAVRRSLRPARADEPTRSDTEAAWLVSLATLVPLSTALLYLWVDHGVDGLPLLLGAVGAALAAAAWVDRGQSGSDLPLGTLVRAGALGTLALAAELRASEVAVLAGVLAVASAADALRLRHVATALGASLALPIAVGAFVSSTGLAPAQTGVALTVAAVVMAGAGSLLGRRWAVPVMAGVAFSLGSGLVLSWSEPTAFAHALLVSGGLGLAVGTALRRPDVMALGGVALTGGWWLRLTEAEVGVAEPYLVPVAVVLLLAGARARAAGASSWVAYGPVVALGGGAALAERLQGGAGWHAVVAGAVGVAAVMAGANRRLAAPLVLGTALLVALAGYETLGMTAGMPTWIWLAAGGATLVGAGVLMERHEVGPLETGRRLVDVVADRYS